MKIPKKLVNLVMKLAGGLSQGEEHHNPVKVITPGMPQLLRQVAAEGAVLLENRSLPLEEGTRVSVFGRVQTNPFATGYGSGGDVNVPYTVNLLEGIRNCPRLSLNEDLAKEYETFDRENPIDHGVWGMWPRCYPEMPLTREQVEGAAAVSDAAVVILGRSSGEDRENVLEPGSFYLRPEERTMLELVTGAFPKTVLLLNVGSVTDLSFLEEFSFAGTLLLWQGGMESGNAAAELLCGLRNPCGRLTDTVARAYEDYPSADCFGDPDKNEYREDIYVGYRWFETFGPEKVLFPFGHGLSYTQFQKTCRPLEGLSWEVTVTNTGSLPGKETALLYVQKPCGPLGNPERELAAFAKTGLLAPGEAQTLTLSLSERELASYDDCGLTGNDNCWVQLKGDYRFFLGGSVREAEPVGGFALEEDRVVERLAEAAAPAEPFPILARQELGGRKITVPRRAAPRTVDLRRRIREDLPEGIFQTGDKGFKLRDVKEGRVSLDAFVAQLSLEELEALTRGGGIMNHPLGAKGNAGIFGGITESLRKKGVPPVVTTDGPSGIRLYDSCSLVPIGTLLACTYDTELIRELFRQVGLEMKDRGSDVLLAPGMNIHRNPLCGRNFEYFSEDPLVSGRMAGAVVRGVQSVGLSACPKHFACNNQEYRRSLNDSVVSQRALREIYLRGFELCVKEASPKNLMTSYNKINGVWGHYHFELVSTILRDQWGYQGNVITDWWMRSSASPEFPQLRDNGYRIRARVDVLMPGSDRIPFLRKNNTALATWGKKDGITLGELQQAAKNVLRCVMDIKQL